MFKRRPISHTTCIIYALLLKGLVHKIGEYLDRYVYTNLESIWQGTYGNPSRHGSGSLRLQVEVEMLYVAKCSMSTGCNVEAGCQTTCGVPAACLQRRRHMQGVCCQKSAPAHTPGPRRVRVDLESISISSNGAVGYSDALCLCGKLSLCFGTLDIVANTCVLVVRRSAFHLKALVRYDIAFDDLRETAGNLNTT